MNIAFLSSQGGHLGQIKLIFTKEVIGINKAILITETSEKNHPPIEKYFQGDYKTYFFIKDHLKLNPFLYFLDIMKLREIFKKEEIETLVTNGAQLSIPAVVASKLLGIKTVFLDTVIRVKTPNWSARACYLFSDIFLVQHQT